MKILLRLNSARLGALQIMTAGVLLAAASLVAAQPDYAVVVSRQTADLPDWKAVVDVLVAKHHASTITFSNAVTEALPALRRQFPRYVCFVAQPEEVTREFVVQVHRLTSRFDDDPYTDCFWGILTGYDAANALRIARQSASLTIRKVAAGTELAMNMVEAGTWYSESTKNKMVRKEPGKPAVELKGPDDTTEALVNLLNAGDVDLFVTSGHATEHDWQLGYAYRNGAFRHADGHLFGVDTQGRKFPINSPNPKVYLPVGNCLMGHMDRRDCMAASWLNSGGVCQMFGYIQPTWYGYMGWGVLNYFVEQPGRYTLAEAFFANHHALVRLLATYFPELADADTDVTGRTTSPVRLSDQAKAAGLTLNDARGLLFDRDMVAFYGDPAWPARMADQPRPFEQRLTWTNGTGTFEILPQRGAESFRALNQNGSQRSARPFLAYLPKRVAGVKILAGGDLDPTITDDFILVPSPSVCDPARKYRVVFTAKELP